MRIGEPEALRKAVAQLSRLAGVGPSLARRIVFHLIRRTPDENQALIDSLTHVLETVQTCPVCGALAESSGCPICGDPERDSDLMCVVEEARDVLAVERSGHYHGQYHVLGGTLSPLEGRGPEDLRIAALLARLESGSFKEVIVATDPDMEGDATAHYLAKVLRPLNVRATRIARGLPVGGTLEFVDQSTLGQALDGRITL